MEDKNERRGRFPVDYYRDSYIAALDRNLVLRADLAKTKGALRDAEARVADLHKQLEIASRMNRNQFRLLSRIRDAVDDTSDYEAATY